MSRRDESYNPDGTVARFKQWPELPDGTLNPAGQMDDNGTLRPLTAEEQAEAIVVNNETAMRAETSALRDDFAAVRTERDDAATRRAEMDWESTPAEPLRLAKWTPVAQDALANLPNNATTATIVARVNELATRQRATAQLANDLRIDNKRQWGSIRFLAAVLVRKLRKDRDDTI